MIPPANAVSMNSASVRFAGSTGARAEPAASAAALVVVITISRVLLVSPPAIGATRLAYSPCTGFTPASTLAAMPSGTPPMATGRPATTSVCNSARSVGRADAHHRLIAAPGAGRRPSLISRPKPLPGHPSPPRPAAASIRRGSTAHRQTCLR